jgi:large subunit ribosomal protein L2
MHNFIVNKVKKQLIIGFSKRAGRNFFGRKTIFTQGGGLRVKLRLIDFRRNLIGNSLLLSIDKDINRTGFIGLVCYDNGLFSYILLSSMNNIVGKTLIKGFSNTSILGSPTFLLNISTGNIIHHIELFPGSTAKISRAAGSSSFIISRDDNFTFLKMNSG